MFMLNIVNDNIASAFMSTSKLNDSILWHARLSHVHFKRMQDMSKDGLIPAFDMDTEKCKTCMLNKITKKPFQKVKRQTKVLELIYSDLCDLHATPSLGNRKYFVTFIDDASKFCYVYLLQSKDEALDKFKVFKTKVELQQGSQIKRFRTDKGVVRLPDPKLKTLGEKGIECIFVGYAKHSKAFRFYVIEPNDSVSINSINELRDAIFDENIFSSVPRLSLRIPNGTKDIGGSVFLEEVTKEDDPKTYDEAMKSHDVAFWKEAINDEMDSIMGNNTWVLADLPPGCKPFGCKWIFKRKLKVDRTIEKFKARLVIQGFKQKSGIDYFDTYAPVVRISTIRLLIAMASIHNLIIHQMDVKIAFSNGELDEEAPKQWHQKFDEVVLSNGYLLNQADKYVYRKFDETGKGFIICLYVDDMLIFGTDQVQVDLTKEFLSSRFSMKDMGEADIDIYWYPSVLEGYTDASWISNIEDNSSTSGWVFQLGSGTISWASKKQTCITGSIIKYEFMALAAASKEAEWFKNLLFEIPLWSKPITPISIRCDNDHHKGMATEAKPIGWLAGSQPPPTGLTCPTHSLNFSLCFIEF
ncbi:zinc finger, CCHC-type containing protein [Tanacetum coccineum]